MDPVACDRCGAKTLILWVSASDSFCDSCAVQFGAQQQMEMVTTSHAILFAPASSSIAGWFEQSAVTFSGLRKFIDCSVRDECPREFNCGSARTVLAVALLIHKLDNLAGGGGAQNGDAVTRLVQCIRNIIDFKERQSRRECRNAQPPRPAPPRHRWFKATPPDVTSSDERAGRRRIVARVKREFEVWCGNQNYFAYHVPARQVHWTLLQGSEQAWTELQSHFENRSRARNERYEIDRLRFVHKFRPNEIYVGRESFDGYVVFCFHRGHIAVLECPKVGNALYFMSVNDWKFLSQLSKTELQIDHSEDVTRVPHTDRWREDVTMRMKACGIEV
jgi:hypothetical protein